MLRLVAAGLLAATTLASALLALAAFTVGSAHFAEIAGPTPFLALTWGLQPLAAPFLALLALVAAPAALWTLKGGRPGDGPAVAAFAVTMLLVLLAQSVAAFALAWEAMSLTSAFAAAAAHERRAVRRATLTYLIVAQAGALSLVAALTLAAVAAGSPFFTEMTAAASALPVATRDAIITLALLGCASKAGLAPLHFWLPRAHPVAPPQASALLSGAMLKIALYALALVVFRLAAPASEAWGVAIVALGAVSAVLGVLYALVERDIKRLLAYSSIENVGIIALGVGAAIVTARAGDPAIAALALAAAFFHAINHALFKGLAFLGAGSVAEAVHCVDLERLGGLAQRLRWTGTFFLIACCAIAALPPLNGFASEWSLLQALVAGIGAGDLTTRATLLGALAALALTGGLAAACAVRVYGTAFLGVPREPEVRSTSTRELFDARVAAQAALAVGVIALGLVPALAFAPLLHVAAATVAPGSPFNDTAAALAPALSRLGMIPLAAALPMLGVGLAWWLLAARGVRRVPAWTCGSPMIPAMQYGATAFAKPLRTIFAFLLIPERQRTISSAGSSWFPTRIFYRTASRNIFDEGARLVAAGAWRAARRLRIVQSGRLRHYVAYALAAIALAVGLAR